MLVWREPVALQGALQQRWYGENQSRSKERSNNAGERSNNVGERANDSSGLSFPAERRTAARRVRHPVTRARPDLPP